MQSNLELLRNALLVTLVILLVYVLYKRLIHLMHRQNVVAKYPALPNTIEWRADGSGLIEVTLREKMYLVVAVYDATGSSRFTIAEGEFDPGKHAFAFRTEGLEPGKYYYKISSPHEEASQYFTV